MNVSKREAQEALESVQSVTNQLRRSIASGSTPFYMILWGAIWFVGYLCSYFARGLLVGWIWLGLTGAGSIISFVIGMRFRDRMRQGRADRFTLLWISLIVYAALNWWVATPTRGEQASMLIVLFCMFGYVIAGLWVEPTATWTGVITTLLAVIGYAFFLPYFYLWMAFLGGGTLILSGIYMLRKWK